MTPAHNAAPQLEPSTDLQSPAATFHEKEVSLKAEHEAAKPITMQDVRLAAGEGKLTPADVLAGCNAELLRRAAHSATSSDAGRESFAPCPTCHQYSHSIGQDRLAEAFNHFQSMIAHPVRGHPMGHAFDKQTRDAAQVLMAAARAGGDGWRVGDQAEYTAAVRPIRVTLLENVEGWWQVRCSDDSLCVVRPSRLRPLPAAPDAEVL